MIKKIVYQTNYEPNFLTLHALFSTIVDKKHENNNLLEYKIFYKDRMIILIINEDDIKEKLQINDLKYNDFYEFKHYIHEDKFVSIKLKKMKEEEFIYKKYQNGDNIEIFSTISYAINKKNNFGKKRNICPIDLHGKIIVGTKIHTFKYLEEKTGIEIKENYLEKNNRFKYIPIEDKFHKIKFYNIFSLILEGVVKNDIIFNKLAYNSIGQKRNYGFGNVFIRDFNEYKTI